MNFETFLIVTGALIRIGMAFSVGYSWHTGHQDIAVGVITFFILEAIHDLRDRVNDIHSSERRNR